MKLSEMPYDSLHLGDIVITDCGTLGIITSLDSKGDSNKPEDYSIVVVWETGKSSWDWENHFKSVSYLGQQSSNRSMMELGWLPEIGQIFSLRDSSENSIKLWKVIDNCLEIDGVKTTYCLLRLLDNCYEQYLAVNASANNLLKLVRFSS